MSEPTRALGVDVGGEAPDLVAMEAATETAQGAVVRGHVVARLSTELESVDLEAEEYLAREREASLHTRPHPSATGCGPEVLKQHTNTLLHTIQMLHRPQLPILQWLPKYNLGDLPGDLNAGLVLAVFLIPQGMAYAVLLGVPPIHGLYCGIFFSLIYAPIGTSKQCCPANIALTTIMMANALDSALPSGPAGKALRPLAALQLTFMIGIVQIVLGLCRLGAVAHYLSFPVMHGFNTAAIIITVISQLKYFVGVKVPAFAFPYQTLQYLLTHLNESNLWELAVGGTAFLVLLAITLWKRLSKPRPSLLYRVAKMTATMSPVIVVVIATAVTYKIHKDNPLVKMKVIGSLPNGFSTFAAGHIDAHTFNSLGGSAVTMGVVSYLLNYGVFKHYATLNAYDVNLDQELMSLGLCNAVGAFFGCFSATMGFARASLMVESGGRTQLCSLVSAILIIIAVMFCGPLFYYLPISGLAALISAAVIGALNFNLYFEAYKCPTRDFAILMATTLLTIGIGIDNGIYCGIGLAICDLLLRSSYPDLKPLGRLPGTKEWRTLDRYSGASAPPHIHVLRLDEALTFVNVDYVKEQLLQEARRMEAAAKACPLLPPTTNPDPEKADLEKADADRGPTKADGAGTHVEGGEGSKRMVHGLFVVLDASGINFLDLSGLKGLVDISRDLHVHGVRLLVARAKHRTRDMLRSSSTLFHQLGGDKVYLSVEEMVGLLEHHTARHGLTPNTSHANLQSQGEVSAVSGSVSPVPLMVADSAVVAQECKDAARRTTTHNV